MSKSRTSSKQTPTSTGVIVIVSAPSGCGKTTLVDRLLKRHPDWVRSISATTRQPRTGEKDGQDYVFLKLENFEEMKKNGDFLEHALVHHHWYGTPKAPVFESYEKGKTVILAIDIQGMLKVKEALGERFPVLTLFVLPPSLKSLRERLEGRKTEGPEEIEKRMQVAEMEIKQANLYQKTVVNQNVEQTVLEIDEMINQFRKEKEKIWDISHLKS